MVNAPDCDCPTVDAPEGEDVEICEGDPIAALTVTVGNGQTADWYDAAMGGNLLSGSTTSYNPNMAGTFYVEARDLTTGCTSSTRTAITLTINPKPTVGDLNVTCSVEGIGTVTAQAMVSSGTLEYQLDSSAFQLSNVFSNVSNGIHVVTVRLQGTDCMDDKTVFVNCQPEQASLGDFVWYDTNENGLQDDGEEGVEGVLVTLYDGDGNAIATTNTDSTGFYQFFSLVPGVPFQVGFSDLPTGYTFTTQTVNTTNGSDADPTTGLAPPVVLAPGENNPNIDAGIIELQLLGSLGDYVWYDLDEDGQQDGDEPGIPNVTVTLTDEDGNFLGVDVTDSNGYYLFTDLPAGTYTVSVPSSTTYNGTNVTTSLISQTTTLDAGETDLTLDFPYVSPDGPTDVCTDIFTPVTICLPIGDDYEITNINTTFDCNITENDSCFTYLPFPAFSGTDTVIVTVCQVSNPTNCFTLVYYIHVGTCQAPDAVIDYATITPSTVIINGVTTTTTRVTRVLKFMCWTTIAFFATNLPPRPSIRNLRKERLW